MGFEINVAAYYIKTNTIDYFYWKTGELLNKAKSYLFEELEVDPTENEDFNMEEFEYDPLQYIADFLGWKYIGTFTNSNLSSEKELSVLKFIEEEEDPQILIFVYDETNKNELIKQMKNWVLNERQRRRGNCVCNDYDDAILYENRDLSNYNTTSEMIDLIMKYGFVYITNMFV
jgi:hypothetical protein